MSFPYRSDIPDHLPELAGAEEEVQVGTLPTRAGGPVAMYSSKAGTKVTKDFTDRLGTKIPVTTSNRLQAQPPGVGLHKPDKIAGEVLLPRVPIAGVHSQTVPMSETKDASPEPPWHYSDIAVQPYGRCPSNANPGTGMLTVAQAWGPGGEPPTPVKLASQNLNTSNSFVLGVATPVLLKENNVGLHIAEQSEQDTSGGDVGGEHTNGPFAREAQGGMRGPAS